MEGTQLVAGLFVILLIIIFIHHVSITISTKNVSDTYYAPNNIKNNCSVTPYGCCPDGITSRVDQVGSNCRYPGYVTPVLGGNSLLGPYTPMISSNPYYNSNMNTTVSNPNTYAPGSNPNTYTPYYNTATNVPMQTSNPMLTQPQQPSMTTTQSVPLFNQMPGYTPFYGPSPLNNAYNTIPLYQ